MMQPNGSSTSQRATNSPQPENSNGTTGNVVTFGGNRSQSIGYVNHKQTTDPDDSGTPLLPRSKS